MNNDMYIILKMATIPKVKPNQTVSVCGGGGGFAIVLNDCLFGLNIEKTSTFGPGFRLGQSSVLHQLEGKIHIMDLQEKTVEKCRNSWTNHTEATESS